MTLIELLTSMTILAFVLTALIGVFVSGLHAEVDMNNRFQAQQNARLALTSMRQDIRTACSRQLLDVSGNPVSSPSPTTFEPEVQLGYSCTTAAPTGSSQVTWCVQPISANDYGLYRQSGATCSSTGGIKRADQLTSNAVFALPPSQPGQRPELQVAFSVDASLSTAGGTYDLGDTVMLRNAAPAS